jgi:hypothetical protein
MIILMIAIFLLGIGVGRWWANWSFIRLINEKFDEVLRTQKKP